VSTVRVGQGFDVHRFGPGDHVMLGGIRIPHDQGVEAHSDGDVVLHALTDALLGAATLGDIGHHFPDKDPQWAGADSSDLLRRVLRDVKAAGWQPVNVDCTILAERPRIAMHVPAIREHISDVLDISVSAVSVKATTMERMGFIGQGEGLAAMAVALLESA
jgi:2-C-methyl-D-erythritol 2,4-cyclodiphosphate synthase